MSFYASEGNMLPHRSIVAFVYLRLVLLAFRAFSLHEKLRLVLLKNSFHSLFVLYEIYHLLLNCLSSVKLIGTDWTLSEYNQT